MDNSILRSTKKILGISPDDDSFDLDIITHINTALSILQTEGTGAAFHIEDEESEWGDFTSDPEQLALVRTIVYLRVRMLFDPPTTSYMIAAMERQIEELEWRLNEWRESEAWVDPDPPVGVVDDG